MRVREVIVRAGFFWLPNRQEKRIPGTLSISDGGRIELETVGNFDDNGISDDDEIPIIIGHVEGGDGYVTLIDCFYTLKRLIFGGGISRSKIIANTAIIGAAYDEKSEIQFNNFRFRVEKIGEWLELSGVSVEMSKDLSSATINFVKPDNIVFAIEGVGTVEFALEYSLPSAGREEETKITQKPYIILRSETAQNLKYFYSISHKIASLINFAADSTLSIYDVEVSSDDLTREINNYGSVPIYLKLFYASRPFSEKLSNVKYYQMFFRYRDIETKVSAVFSKWFQAYERISPPIHLYFMSQNNSSGHLEGRFISLVQCLESFHRRSSTETLMDDSSFIAIKTEIIKRCPDGHKNWLEARLKYGNEVSLSHRKFH